MISPLRRSKRNKAIEIAVALDDFLIPKDIIVFICLGSKGRRA